MPRVSPYRLAAHLVSAFTIYSGLVWTAMDIARPIPLLAAAAGTSGATAAHGRAIRSRVLPFAALVAVRGESVSAKSPLYDVGKFCSSAHVTLRCAGNA